VPPKSKKNAGEHSAEIYERQVNEILKQAGDDPRQAIAAAATLPVQVGHAVPRSETLLSIAQVGWKKNPSASEEALKRMADSLKKVDPGTFGRWLRVRVGRRVQYCWSDGVEVGNNMKDTDLARRLLQEGMEQAER
jgi:hypothetical protein